MKKKLLLVLVLSMFVVLVAPNTVLAQLITPITITGLIANVARLVWLVATILVVIFWVITGVLFLSSQGSPERISTAKKSLFAAIAGTILVILAFSAGVIIENAILFGR